jgi:hypothetical protein
MISITLSLLAPKRKHILCLCCPTHFQEGHILYLEIWLQVCFIRPGCGDLSPTFSLHQREQFCLTLQGQKTPSETSTLPLRQTFALSNLPKKFSTIPKVLLGRHAPGCQQDSSGFYGSRLSPGLLTNLYSGLVSKTHESMVIEFVSDTGRTIFCQSPADWLAEIFSKT